MRKSPFLASDILGHWTPQRGEKSMGWVPLCGQASLRRAQPVQSSVAALDDKLAFGLSNWVNCRVIPKWGRPEEELTGVGRWKSSSILCVSLRCLLSILEAVSSRQMDTDFWCGAIRAAERLAIFEFEMAA